MAEKLTPQGLIVGLIPNEEDKPEQPHAEEKAPARGGRKPKENK